MRGKWDGCPLEDDDIDCMCLHFREVFLLWDGSFSLARKIDPTPEDEHTYQMFVDTALHGSQVLQCSIMPKVHIMVRHIAWQMINIPGRVGGYNGRLGGATPSVGDAAAPALSDCAGPRERLKRATKIIHLIMASILYNFLNPPNLTAPRKIEYCPPCIPRQLHFLFYP
jgi:hypothetical protein